MTIAEVPSPSPELTRLSRQCWGMLESLHVVGYLTPGPYAAYAELGLHGRRGYFAARAAPMGAVGPQLVTATFYVFAPSLVATAMPSAWELVTPEEMTRVRYAAVEAALRELLGPDAGSPSVAQAAELAREACAGLTAPGRPLYAAHSSLTWPDDPLMQLWHASALVREHRGDGHMGALVQAALPPVEALILSGTATGNLEFVRTTRGWTDEQWAAGGQRLRDRGLLDETDALTPDGVALVTQVETATDRAAVEGWAHLGMDDSKKLRELVRPLRQKIFDSGALPGWIRSRG